VSKEVRVFNLKLSTRNMSETIRWIKNRIKINKGAIIYCCTLNEARMHDNYVLVKKIINEADLRTADGMPLVWGLRLKTGIGERVYGPDLMKNIFINDKTKVIKHFFLGGTNDTLVKIKKRLVSEYKYKQVNIGYFSPQFKQKFSQSDYLNFKQIIKTFNPDIVWVGMGSEKQLIVTDQLSKMVNRVVWITVGAAFDYLAGTKKQCPKLIRNMGLEWLYRWLMEPRRLTNRYWKVLRFIISRNINKK